MSMPKLRNCFPALALLASMALLGSPSKSEAGLLIEASVDGGGFFNLDFNPNSAGPASFSGRVNSSGVVVAPAGIFEISALAASSNSPGTTTFADLLSSTLKVENLRNATHDIVLRISATDFTAPVTPPNVLMDSSIGGSVTTGHADNALTFQSYVNTSNDNLAMGLTTGPQTPSITTSPGSFSNNAPTLVIDTLGSPYSIVQQFTMTLGNRAVVNFGTNTQLNLVPEPGTLAMVFAGLPLIGLGVWKRRRQAQA